MDSEFIRSATISPVFTNAVPLPRMCSLHLSLSMRGLSRLSTPAYSLGYTLLARCTSSAITQSRLFQCVSSLFQCVSSLFHKFHEDMIDDCLIHHSTPGYLGHSRALNKYLLDGWMNEWLNDWINTLIPTPDLMFKPFLQKQKCSFNCLFL